MMMILIKLKIGGVSFFFRKSETDAFFDLRRVGPRSKRWVIFEPWTQSHFHSAFIFMLVEKPLITDKLPLYG